MSEKRSHKVTFSNIVTVLGPKRAKIKLASPSPERTQTDLEKLCSFHLHNTPNQISGTYSLQFDGPHTLSTSTQVGYEKAERKSDNLNYESFGGSGAGSNEAHLLKGNVNGTPQYLQPSQPLTSSSNSVSKPQSITNSNGSSFCKVCFSKPENGLFLHSDIVHKFGCYSCAKKFYFEQRHCPLCIRKVYKVIQLL